MVVLWFTHPVMELLTRVPFFRDGHPLSGFNRERLTVSGARPRYAGAGRVAMPDPVGGPAPDPVAEDPVIGTPGARAAAAPAAAAPAGPRLTIAERRAAARKAAAETEEGR